MPIDPQSYIVIIRLVGGKTLQKYIYRPLDEVLGEIRAIGRDGVEHGGTFYPSHRIEEITYEENSGKGGC